MFAIFFLSPLHKVSHLSTKSHKTFHSSYLIISLFKIGILSAERTRVVYEVILRAGGLSGFIARPPMPIFKPGGESLKMSNGFLKNRVIL